MTSPRLVRCRVRDFASCFYACGLPLEEEPDNLSCGKTIPEAGDGSRRRTTPAAMTMVKKGGGEGGPVDHVDFYRSLNICGPSRGMGVSNQPEPRFTEEDYIVFRFREDGEIDVINEGNQCEDEIDNHHRGSTSATSSTSRPMINRKKGDEKVVANGNGHSEVIEKNSSEQPTNVNSASKMESFESCDSNLSDTTTTSTSSFAFPILGLDWIGSPVHMPVPEKPTIGLRCCSF